MGLMDTIKGWFSKGRDMAGDVAEKAGDVAEGAWDKTKDVAGDVAEKAGDVAEAGWEKAKDVADDIKDRFDGDDEGEGGINAMTKYSSIRNPPNRSDDDPAKT